MLLSDAFSVINNPAKTADSLTELAMGFSLPYSINELLISSFTAKKRTGQATFGLGLQNSGNAGFQQNDLYMSAAKALANLSFGTSLQVRQISISENGNHTSFLLNIGASSNIIPHLDFGIFISNINQAGLGIDERQVFESHLKIAAAIDAGEKLDFFLETDQELNTGSKQRIGLEYRISKALILYTGISNEPIEPALGFKLLWKNWSMAQSLRFHQRLGFSHAFNLTYALNSHK